MPNYKEHCHIRSIYDSLTLQVYYQSMITNAQTCVNLFKQRKQNKKLMFYLHGALQLSEYVHASYRDVYNCSKRYTDPVSSPQKIDFRRENWCPERMSDLSEVTQLVGLKLTCLDNSSFFYESKLQICNTDIHRPRQGEQHICTQCYSRVRWRQMKRGWCRSSVSTVCVGQINLSHILNTPWNISHKHHTKENTQEIEGIWNTSQDNAIVL